MDQLTDALRIAIKKQMDDNVTTFIEVVLNKEPGDPFRRDAMKNPVSVACITKNGFIPQQSRL